MLAPRSKAALPWVATILLASTVACAVASTSASACEVMRALSGERSLAAVQHPKRGPYPSYTTYLLRNAARDADGTLRAAMVGELVPARWGFDINGTSGRTIGLVNLDDLLVEDMTDDKACASHRIVLRPAGRDTVTVLDHERAVGTISGLSHRLLRVAGR